MKCSSKAELNNLLTDSGKVKTLRVSFNTLDETLIDIKQKAIDELSKETAALEGVDKQRAAK